MPKILVLTLIADDRPGLVGRLSEAVAGAGGNWLESRMAHLAGKFAGVARVEIAGDDAAPIAAALNALQADGFRLTIEETEAAAEPVTVELSLELVGPDQPGIVRDVSRCLAERRVSVEELETDRRPAPMGGEYLFHARARISLPDGLDVDELRAALEALSGALMVDIGLHAEGWAGAPR